MVFKRLCIFLAGIADEIEPLFISLGSFCGPALTLKTANVRHAAYPFDWMLSVNGDRLIDVLDQDFYYFLDDRYFSIYVNGILLNHLYEIEFSHEGEWNANNYNQKMQIFKDKYQRRINRFREIRNYKGKVFFIRFAWSLSTFANYAFLHEGNLVISEEYALRLSNALKRYFPHVDVYLIILNPIIENAPMKIIDNIVILQEHLNLYSIKNIFE